MAYGTFCAEHVIDALGLDRARYQGLLDILWSYTTSMNLDEWEDEVCSRIGQDLPEIIERVDAPLLVQRMLECVVSAGIDNLYGGVTGYSECTWEPIVRLLALLEEHGISVPAVEPFLKSRFSEYHGWGDPFTRDSLMAG